MTAEGRYLKWLFATMTLLVGVVGAANLVVDPYGAIGSRRIAEFNADKPDFVEQLRMTHVYAIERRKPRCIVSGTSRTGRGLDPDSAALAGFDCYNVALPAISLYEVRRYFQHAQAIRPLERLVLALDFRLFYTETDTTGAFLESRLAVDPEGDVAKPDVLLDPFKLFPRPARIDIEVRAKPQGIDFGTPLLFEAADGGEIDQGDDVVRLVHEVSLL